ncbi:unnamed protein product [Sphagnum troendelagicum]
MAGLAIASNGLTLAGEISNYLQAYREKWNQTSKAISDFGHLHHQLERKKAEWAQKLEEYGLTIDEGLQTRFETASKRLDEESQKFSNLQSNCCLSFWTKARASPEILTNSINILINDFDEIPNFLKEQEDENRLLNGRANDTPDSVGFELDPRIPLVNTLIKRVGYNPLGLALILKTMKDPLQEEYWNLAIEDFNSIVADDASFFQKKRVEAFGQPYPYTLSAAMLMVLEGLHEKARDLLYLLAIFGDHGVPQPLLGLAFGASHPKLLPGDFVRARDELEEHDLIQVESRMNFFDHSTLRRYMLNPTRRLLIREKKQGEVSAKLVALLNNSAFKEGNEDKDALDRFLNES